MSLEDFATTLYPLHMMEVMTVNSSGQLNELEDPTDQSLFFSVGKTFCLFEGGGYGEGTVFVIKNENLPFKTHSNTNLVFLTCYHNVKSSFFEIEEIYVVFLETQKNYLKMVFHDQKHCKEKCFKATSYRVKEELNDIIMFDSITNYPLSISNDIVELILEEKCNCGNIFKSNFAFIPLTLGPADFSKELTLIGFPGSLVEKKIAIPYQQNMQTKRSYLTGGNTLKMSKGHVLSNNEHIICCSNSSVAGMSGSVILQEFEGQYKAVGILQGGPAVRFHRDCIEISDNLSKNMSLCEESLERCIEGSNGETKYYFNDVLCCLRNNYALEKIKERLRSHYNDLIRLFSENLTKESKIQILSHNYAQLLFSYNL